MNVPPTSGIDTRCGHDGCKGTIAYVREDFGSLSTGGDYEVWRCGKCNHTFHLPVGD